MTLLKWLNNLGISQSMQTKIGLTVFYIVLLTLLRLLSGRLIHRHVKDVKRHYYWASAATYTISFLGIILLVVTWIKGISSLATYLGLVSAGMALALRDIIANIAGWLFIILRQPFRVGDRIQIGDFRGDVIDVNLFQFTIIEIGNRVDADQSTGRIIDIPNGLLMTQPIANYTKCFEFIWDEIPVLITHESNWKAAKQILMNIVQEKAEKTSHEAEAQIRTAAQKYMIFYKHLTPAVFTTMRDSGILLTIRYLTKPHQRRIMQQTIWEAILDAFAASPDISLATSSAASSKTITK